MNVTEIRSRWLSKDSISVRSRISLLEEHLRKKIDCTHYKAPCDCKRKLQKQVGVKLHPKKK